MYAQQTWFLWLHCVPGELRDQRAVGNGIRDSVLGFLNDPARPDRLNATFNRGNGYQTPREVRFGSVYLIIKLYGVV